MGPCVTKVSTSLGDMKLRSDKCIACTVDGIIEGMPQATRFDSSQNEGLYERLSHWFIASLINGEEANAMLTQKLGHLEISNKTYWITIDLD